MTGIRRYHINYRHVIDSLLRKPGGIRNYRYREDLFPRAIFRQAWEALDRRLPPRKADLAYLRILKLAAGGLETDVAEALKLVLSSKNMWDDRNVAELVQPTPKAVPQLTQQSVELSVYDQLLSRENCHVSA